MKQTLANFWFRPYTPIIFIIIVLFILAKFVAPTFQKATAPQNLPLPTPQTSPTPPLEITIVSALSKLMVLPKDETPQVITIIDIAKFKDQPFFKDAKNDDILVLYAKNKKAILFDPKANKILNTAPIAIATESATTTPSAL